MKVALMFIGHFVFLGSVALLFLSLPLICTQLAHGQGTAGSGSGTGITYDLTLTLNSQKLQGFLTYEYSKLAPMYKIVVNTSPGGAYEDLYSCQDGVYGCSRHSELPNTPELHILIDVKPQSMDDTEMEALANAIYPVLLDCKVLPNSYAGYVQIPVEYFDKFERALLYSQGLASSGTSSGFQSGSQGMTSPSSGEILINLVSDPPGRSDPLYLNIQMHAPSS